MLRLLLCLACALGLSLLVLQLRQQRLELNHQASQVHDQIEAQQAKLWNQQLQIAMFTAPNAINQTVDAQALNMVRLPAPAPARPARWVDVAPGDDNNPDAE